MEVDQAHLRKEILEIFRNIANADYVVLDLEMSGITTRQPGEHRNSGKPTVHEQYEEVKDAAESFQIVQLGLTCVEADEEKGYYLAKPYNFNVNPRSADGVDLRLERTFSFSSSACDFLIKNKFDFGKVFTEGVPYLSRYEECVLRDEYNNRAEKNAKLEDIIIDLDDKSTLEFSRGVRQTIRDWLAAPPKHDFVNISHPDGHIKDGQVNALTGYQKRLVHQIVRNEFPQLKVIGRKDGSFMQVSVLDLDQEAKFQAGKLRKFNSQICRQKALGWIFEALSNGDLSGIDPEWLASKNSEAPEDQLPVVKKQLGRLIKTLRTKKHVIVGHNLFMDLAFIHKTFIGPLPSVVGHFQETIHKTFPMVIDTKYLATHDANAMNPRSNLKELLAPFKKIHVPLVVLHEDHTAYGGTYGKEHEAGYDSWMTAELFIKISAKLFSTYDPDSLNSALADQSYDSDSSSGGGVLLKSRSPVKLPPTKKRATFNIPDNTTAPNNMTEGYGTIRPETPNPRANGSSHDLLDPWPDSSTPLNTEPALSTNTAAPLSSAQSAQFNQFATNSFTEAAKPNRPSKAIPIINPNARKAPEAASTHAERDAILRSTHASMLNPSAKLIHDTDEEAATAAAETKVEQWLPGMKDQFWRPYLNMLRVNAAQGGVCDLAQPKVYENDDTDKGSDGVPCRMC